MTGTSHNREDDDLTLTEFQEGCMHGARVIRCGKGLECGGLEVHPIGFGIGPIVGKENVAFHHGHPV